MALGWRSGYLRYKEFFLNVLLVYRKRPDLRLFLEAGLSLATILIFSIFALRPTLITIATLVREIRTKEEMVSKMDEKIENLNEVSDLFAREEERIVIVSTSVPTFPEPDSFLRQIEGLTLSNSARLLGVSLGEVTLSGKEPERKTKEQLKSLPESSMALTFSISVTGDYPTVSRFLAELENLRRPVKIDAVGLNSSETQEGKILGLVISARTPYIGEGDKE